MKWFLEVFLPSLEDRYSKRGKLWLTAKQVKVCKLYMEYAAARGNMYIDSNGKRYFISIAPNGCASFGIIDLSTGFCI